MPILDKVIFSASRPFCNKLIFAACAAAVLCAQPVPVWAEKVTETAATHAEDDAVPMEERVDVHALALHGEPKYDTDFKQFSYVNPDAPKGGNITTVALGTFDSLNPYILRGLPAAAVTMTSSSLLKKSLDEPLTSYGLLAESMTVPEDRSWVTFKLRKEARWHDDKPVTALDVLWSLDALKKHGHPFYRSYYSAVEKVIAIDLHTVKFIFKKAGNRELPLIVGDLPVLPKHYWTAKGRDFSKTTQEPPLGNGPYKVKSVDAGRRLVLERVKDWWGENLPVSKGQNNFETITIDYYRDPGVAFQAFLAGNVNFRQENIAKNWTQGYNHPAVRKGQIIKDEVKHALPTGMQAFVINTRRAKFQDPLVREALAYTFDFEWSNKQFAFGSYVRCNSYFSNSELGATQPISDGEIALLEPYRDQLPERVFTHVYQPPKTSGSGDIRQNLRRALQLMREAGFKLDKGLLVDKGGKPFTFEIMTDSPMFDRWLLPFVANLKKLGVTVKIREIDSAQYQNRMNEFDFDMTITTIPQSLTPGNEQYSFFGSETADLPGSQNLAGVKDPVVDMLIDKIIHAETREQLITATRAMDRVLLWNFYVIPQWYIDRFRIAYWNTLDQPKESPPYGLPVLETWWSRGADKKNGE